MRANERIEFVVFDSDEVASESLRNGDVDLLLGRPSMLIEPDDGLVYSRAFARITQALVVTGSNFGIGDLQGSELRFEGTVRRLAQSLVEGYELAGVSRVPQQPLATSFESDSRPLMVPSLRWALHRLSEEGLTGQLRAVPLTTRFIFAAAAADRPDLLDRFEKGLDKVTSKDLVRVEGQLMPVGASPLFLEPRERLVLLRNELEWLQSHTVVRLGASPWPPLTIIDAKGNYTGIGVETVRELLQHVGLQLRVVGDTSWERVVGLAERGEIDGLGYITPRTDSSLLYTREVVRAPAVLLSQSSSPFYGALSDLENVTLVVRSDYRIRDLIRPQVPESVTIRSVLDSAEAVRLVSEGEADFTLDYLPSARRAIRTQGITNLKVTATVENLAPPLKTAVRSDWPELVSLINRSVAARTREDETRILSQFDRQPTATNEKMYLWAVVPLLLIIAALAANGIVRRRRTNRMIRSSESLLRRAQRLSGSGSWHYDEGTGRLNCSVETHRLYGWNPGQATPKLDEYLDFYDAPSRASLRQAITRSVPSGERHTSDVGLLTSADGRTFHRCNVEHTRTDEVIGTMTDVTRAESERLQREELEAEVHQIERLDALGRLAGGIAHDFNNILAVSLANAELATFDLEPDHPAQKSVREFTKASLRARDLVQQIQVFGRRRDVEYSRMNIVENVSSVASLLASSLPPGITVSSESENDPLFIHGSPSQVDRALMNLGINAGQAMPEGGHLTFRARRRYLTETLQTTTGTLEPGDYVEIEVSDTGLGIPEEDLLRIFEPYFTNRSSGDGTGLGLALVHGTIKEHRGGLAVTSRARQDDRSCQPSTTFQLLIPEFRETQDRPSTRRPPRPEGLPLKPIGNGERILLVDDEAELLESTVRLFEALGFKSDSYLDPAEAVHRFAQEPYRWNLVVTDLLMPGISGAEVVERIKAIRPECPVIISTGFAGDHDLSATPAEAVLGKPVSSEVWIETLRSTLPATRPSGGQELSS